MKYHYTPPTEYEMTHGELYFCNHPLYKTCTLYRKDQYGLAVIQERYNENLRAFFWTSIDPWLVDDIYNQPKFAQYFSEKAEKCQDGIFPTVKVRQIMWALRMKPLPKEWWEQ